MLKFRHIFLFFFSFGLLLHAQQDAPLYNSADIQNALDTFARDHRCDVIVKNIINEPTKVSSDPLINFLLKADATPNADCYKSCLLEEIAKKHPETLCTIAQYYLEKNNNWNSSEQSFMQEWKKSFLTKNPLTQTIAHLATKYLAKPVDFFSPENYQPQLIQAALKERSLNDSGYYVFYHGQQNCFGFYQDFCADLLDECYRLGIINYELPKDFLFARIPKNLKDIMNGGLPVKQDLEEKKLRQEIMSGHANQFRYHDQGMYTNGFLFGSTDTLGSCTWKYITTNSNWNASEKRAKEMGKKIFEWLGQAHIFTLYQQEITDLLDEYTQFINAGRLLQVAIPITLVDECVLISNSTITKVNVSLPDPLMGTATTDKVSVLMPYCFKQYPEAFKNQGWDYEVHFCIVMTEDIMLNPCSGVKVFAYDSAPTEEITLDNGKKLSYQEHLQKRAELIKNIVAAMKNNPQEN